ncbi:MAG TPA: hypothetical protein DCR14_04730 [Acidimicrobiaceae bacterium]|nr:hypothetical protein [Acidimicrobiaceae bacterium]
MSRARTLKALVIGALLGLTGLVAPVSAADPVPPFIAADAHWLSTVNYYRAMAYLPPVTENTSWSQGAYNHSCYMLYNGITHDEIPGKTGYTSSGDQAGNSGNVAVSSAYGTTARSHIELWMTGPFHAIGILRHNLTSSGFGKCDNTGTSPWKSGATLDVIRGINYSIPRPSTPTVWPGNGTTTNLSQFITETPNPLTFCGWSGTAGLPVIAMMPEAVTSATASITGPNGPLQTCRLFGGNTSGTARDILVGDNAVTVIPRNALTPGVYTVTVTTQARTVTWSFTVDPTAATGIMPVPTATPAGPESNFTSINPFRFADSRSNLRITKLLAGVPKRIKVAGSGGLPSDITAISANFTVALPTAAGWLTVYNCTTIAPTASTLNFTAGEAIANAGVFPLGGTDICVVSPKETHLVIDINGYFRPSSTNSYTAMTPTPLLDTTTGLGGSGRRSAGSTLSINIPDAGVGVPSNATAVALNIAGINPSATGWITAFPCGITMPIVSNVNPTVSATKQNFAIVPIPASGEVCFYTHSATDMRIDVLGYFTGSGDGTIVPATPTRVTDTRDVYRVEMNLGTDGAMLPANTTKELQLAGERGIPAGIAAVSLNLTVVFPASGGSITIWECGTQPPVKSITFSSGKTVANGVQVRLSPNGSLCVRSTATTHLVMDVTGWWND